MKANIIAEYIRLDQPHETKLRIYENKKGFRGTLLNSYGKKICCVMSYTKDKVYAIESIKAYYIFTDDNSYCILS